jgi:hypothetical protein
MEMRILSNSTSKQPDAAQLFRMVIGLAQGNDADLVDDPACFPCAADSRQFWQAIRDLIVEIRSSYDYTQSSEFIVSASGKSEQFVSFATRMAQRKRTEHMRGLDDALGTALTSDRILELVPKSLQERLREALASVRALITPR